jgi:hypothetical protein
MILFYRLKKILIFLMALLFILKHRGISGLKY